MGVSKYTDAIADEICRRLENGEALKAICRTPGFPDAATVRKWATDDVGGFAFRYARARDVGLDHLAEELLEIADGSKFDDEPDDSEGGGGKDRAVERDRLRVDARKWYLAKIAPKRYGDRIQHEHSGGVIAGTIVIGAATAPKVIEGRADASHVLPKPDASDDGSE